MCFAEFFQREINAGYKDQQIQQAQLHMVRIADQMHDYEIYNESDGDAQAITLRDAVRVVEKAHME